MADQIKRIEMNEACGTHGKLRIAFKILTLNNTGKRQVGRRQNYKDVNSPSGSTWRRHRKIIVPAFHVKILDKFIHTFNANSKILLKRLERHVGGPGFDMYPYMNFITLDIICGKLMDRRLKQDNLVF
jgi:cytochrome P450